MQSNIKCHMVWTICVLVAIIILLLAVKWSDIPDLAGILNFALGLTSLALALLAIVYAFVANNSLAGTASKIESAASEVSTLVKIIPDKLLAIERTTQDISKAVASQPSTSAPPPPQPPPNNQAILQYVDQVVTQFFAASSWNGLKVMKACKFSHQHRLGVNLAELCKIDGTMTIDYAFGYLVASASASFFQILDHNNFMFTVTQMPPVVSEKIDAAITATINNNFYPVEMRTDWVSQLNRIDGYLNGLLPGPATAQK